MSRGSFLGARMIVKVGKNSRPICGKDILCAMCDASLKYSLGWVHTKSTPAQSASSSQDLLPRNDLNFRDDCQMVQSGLVITSDKEIDEGRGSDNDPEKTTLATLEVSKAVETTHELAARTFNRSIAANVRPDCCLVHSSTSTDQTVGGRPSTPASSWFTPPD